MKNQIIWTGDEVLSMSAAVSFKHGNMMKFRAIDQSIKDSIVSNFPNYIDWTHKGVPAEILEPGKDWQKGMLKLVISYQVEFIPETAPETPSPLDDLRSQLNPE
ncbi:MAG: KGK domain-containing protein [Nostoc sp.]|uniref:KGK domain-containing protein n=1 Tax=Nostoc sp. TaxID=1180 RepID=UPI002FF4D815